MKSILIITICALLLSITPASAMEIEELNSYSNNHYYNIENTILQASPPIKNPTLGNSTEITKTSSPLFTLNTTNTHESDEITSTQITAIAFTICAVLFTISMSITLGLLLHGGKQAFEEFGQKHPIWAFLGDIGNTGCGFGMVSTGGFLAYKELFKKYNTY